jgi:septum formation protein
VNNQFLDLTIESQTYLPQRILLASQSPRRRQLLEGVGVQLEIISNDFEEIVPANMNVYEVAEYLAFQKAAHNTTSLQPNDLLVTADTVVIVNDEVLGKPNDRTHAIATIQKLSGNMHEVVSGVCIRSLSKTIRFSETTRVFFRALTVEQIEHYVDQYQPYDKAGAYGIQEWIGLIGIEKIEGDFYNVMGLPVGKLIQKIQIEFK